MALIDIYLVSNFCEEIRLTTSAYAGLRKLLKPEEEAPRLFSDPLYLRSSYWILSTSAIFSKHFPVYGWGEVGQ